MMTACDVSAIAKPWEVQHRVAKLVADEFFDQGDMEKLQLNTQPVAMMDRYVYVLCTSIPTLYVPTVHCSERKDELPKMQVGFIDVICVPLYRMLSDTFPWIRPLYDGTMDNRKHWQDLAEKVEMGLTWIDHDTIDKPVEDFAGECMHYWHCRSICKSYLTMKLKMLGTKDLREWYPTIVNNWFISRNEITCRNIRFYSKFESY